MQRLYRLSNHLLFLARLPLLAITRRHGPDLWARRLLALRRLIAVCALAAATFGPTASLPAYATPHAFNSACSLYVDNAAASGGNGSLAHPWTTPTGHLNLAPGQVLCLRGDTSGAGRVYPTERLEMTTNGTAAAPVGLRAYPGERVILRSTGGGPVLRITGDYWIVQDLIVNNNGSNWRALILEDGASHNTVRGSEFYNGSNNGVDLRALTADNLIEDNHIHHFVEPDDQDAHCLQVNPRSSRNIIRHNVIHDCSGDGIQIIPPTDEMNQAEFADGIQILENVFYRGTIARAENAIDIKAAKNLIVAGNEMSGYGETSAVLLQKASRNLLFDSNIIHDSLRGFNLHDENGGWPQDLTLRNNILYNLEDYAIQIMGVRNGTFVHNTIVNAAGRAFYVAGNGLITGAIRNNLVVNSGPARRQAGAPFQSVTLGPNGWFSTATDWPTTADVTRSGSPGFENAGAHDYRLQADSYAVDEGVNIGVEFDFEGDDRPANLQADLGADEYALGLRLTALPQDGALELRWTAFSGDQLDSYVISHTLSVSSSPQGFSQIGELSPSTLTHRLTGLTNYQLYTLAVSARDQSNTELAVSNVIVVMPTDLFLFLPLLNRP